MPLDGGVVAAIVSGCGAVVTVSGTTFAAIRGGRDRKDRAVDRTVAEATSEKIAAEKRDIVDETRSRLLQDINDQLERIKAEAKEARNEAERYRREAFDLREALEEEKVRSAKIIQRLTRRAERLTRRAEVLEDWIANNQERFEQLGIEGLPRDILEDRQHHEDEQQPKEEDEPP